MRLEDAQYATALDGRAHEVALRTANIETADEVAGRVSALINDDGVVVRSWNQLVPELSHMIELNARSVWFMYLIIYLIVGLGILNTQRMSALERRREFGVLLAVGLRPALLRRLILLETIFLSLFGAVLGAGVGFALAWRHARVGFDMSAFSDEAASFSVSGINFADRIYFVLAPESVWQPLVVVFVMAVICGAWPAIKSSRLDPTSAIAGRT
ncbi:MAG: FtsX-like permease family protein [Myxococcales bacterium]|nr:FtsX-like permease family protein [Myxococcales bacterium]